MNEDFFFLVPFIFVWFLVFFDLLLCDILYVSAMPEGNLAQDVVCYHPENTWHKS